MSKLQKILLSVFLAGVMLCGVGTGIALVEYSSLTYEGTRILGEDNMVTRNFDYEIAGEPDEVLLLRLDSYTRSYMPQDAEIVEDQTVPAGTVRYRITYNEDLVRPELTFIPYKNEAVEGESRDTDNHQENGNVKSTYAGELSLDILYLGNEFDLIMKNKDMILNDLKHGKFASYDLPYVNSMAILVNPETIDRIKMLQ